MSTLSLPITVMIVWLIPSHANGQDIAHSHRYAEHAHCSIRRNLPAIYVRPPPVRICRRRIYRAFWRCRSKCGNHGILFRSTVPIRGRSLYDAAMEGAGTRSLRPVLMTAMLATIGLIPAAISTGIGSDVQKPLALAIIGGMVTGVLGTLFVLPVLYMLIAGRYPSNGKKVRFRRTGYLSWSILTNAHPGRKIERRKGKAFHGESRKISCRENLCNDKAGGREARNLMKAGTNPAGRRSRRI